MEICRKREKIAFLAHTPLGQGTVLDNASLSHDTLSAAQCSSEVQSRPRRVGAPGAEKLSEDRGGPATPLGPLRGAPTEASCLYWPFHGRS